MKGNNFFIKYLDLLLKISENYKKKTITIKILINNHRKYKKKQRFYYFFFLRFRKYSKIKLGQIFYT